MIVPDLNLSDLPEHYICIVGAGPVGIALALALEKAGLFVLLIEAGGDEADGANHNNSYDVMNPRVHAGASVATRAGLGGTSKAWGGGCTTIDPVDFEHRPHVPYSESAVPYDELARYTPDASKLFGFNSADFRSTSLKGSRSVDTMNLVRTCPTTNIGDRYRQHIERSDGIHFCFSTRLLNIVYDSANCRVQRLELQTASARLSIEPSLTVLCCGGVQSARLLLLMQREHPCLLHGEEGPVGRYYMGHLSGSISRIRFRSAPAARRFLYWRSKGSDFRRNILSISPCTQERESLLGCYFKLSNFPFDDLGHSNGALSALHLGLMARYRSPDYMQFFRPTYETEKEHGSLQLAKHFFNMVSDPITTLSGALNIAAWVAQRNVRPSFAVYNRRGIYTLAYHGEHAPNPESRVTLSDSVDECGLPIARVDLRFGDQDYDSVERSHEVLDDWLRSSGTGALEWNAPVEARGSRIAALARDGYHQIGLTRISTDSKLGVVDSNMAVHGVRNLYVAGCGVLPVSGKGHPTFSAVVLALRLGDHIVSEFERYGYCKTRV